MRGDGQHAIVVDDQICDILASNPSYRLRCLFVVLTGDEQPIGSALVADYPATRFGRGGEDGDPLAVSPVGRNWVGQNTSRPQTTKPKPEPKPEEPAVKPYGYRELDL